MQRRGLGRGLDALIPEIEPGGTPELVRSVKEHGVVQPVLVRRRGDRYELVAGERRWRAAQAAGLRTVPAVVRDLGDREVVEIALIENLQREDLNPMEEAEAFDRLAREFGLTQEETAARVGKSRTHVANMIRLLQLHDSVKALVWDGRLSMGHARAILALKPADQARAAQAVIEGDLSVRRTESLVRKMSAGGKGRRGSGSRESKGVGAAELREVEETLMEALGTRVRIQGSDRKGRIEISFFSRDDLERVLGVIVGDRGKNGEAAAGRAG